ncbi:hypothetical protein [Streptomyces chrestomyceticus]|uniref:hypothetical protein n=1 Tax=Streptomyces chrestomyceticus TaxID=68185 RepID=UPI00340E8771
MPHHQPARLTLSGGYRRRKHVGRGVDRSAVGAPVFQKRDRRGAERLDEGIAAVREVPGRSRGVGVARAARRFRFEGCDVQASKK